MVAATIFVLCEFFFFAPARVCAFGPYLFALWDSWYDRVVYACVDFLIDAPLVCAFLLHKG